MPYILIDISDLDAEIGKLRNKETITNTWKGLSQKRCCICLHREVNPKGEYKQCKDEAVFG